MSQTDPAFVTFEMDAFWFAKGGADPATFLEKYAGRFELLHLKDTAKGFTPDLTGRAPEESGVAIGAGTLRRADVLRTAERTGVKKYYIEDESPQAPQQVIISQQYLKGLLY